MSVRTARYIRHIINVYGNPNIIWDNTVFRDTLLKGGPAVQPATLGRALRKVLRSAIDAASPGDHILVDFSIVLGSHLEIRAGQASEMGGADSSRIDQLFGH